MNKNKRFMLGMAALLLTFGLVLVGCPTDGGDDGGSTAGEDLPAATGANELSGKTYFQDNRKTEFTANGTYKKSEPARNDDGYVLTTDGKYTYTEIENGTYSWDTASKKVVLKPAKIIVWGESGPTLQDAAGYRQPVQAVIDDYKDKLGQDALNQQLDKEGFSSESAYIDYIVSEAFANTTFTYVFAASGAALLMLEELPSSVGTNELDKKTFQDNDSTDGTYSFSGTDYTYTNSSYSSDNATGTYAWNTERKRVYLKQTTIDGKTNVQYFESLSDDDVDNRYNNANDYHADRTNSQFADVDYYPYNITEKTIGYDH
ncbi:MAG: hypothetical protein LBK00_09465 [Treponema sp.]|jgi:hypothetical protein|nr:hypothetical protein [Treponema sp.]